MEELGESICDLGIDLVLIKFNPLFLFSFNRSLVNRGLWLFFTTEEFREKPKYPFCVILDTFDIPHNSINLFLGINNELPSLLVHLAGFFDKFEGRSSQSDKGEWINFYNPKNL